MGANWIQLEFNNETGDYDVELERYGWTHDVEGAASKMAVIGLTRTVAVEFADDGVTVDAICPGAVSGPRIADVIDRQAERMGVDYEEAKRRVFTEDAILGELVQPEDVARMAIYLASEAGRHVTAQDLNVDAGTVWY